MVSREFHSTADHGVEQGRVDLSLVARSRLANPRRLIWQYRRRLGSLYGNALFSRGKFAHTSPDQHAAEFSPHVSRPHLPFCKGQRDLTPAAE
jgi:hypothetical protein